MGKKSFFVAFFKKIVKLIKKGVLMLEEMGKIFLKQFEEYGFEYLGYLVMGLCFGMFFLRSTQKRRFHFIAAGCHILALGCLLQMVLPALELMNPNFKLSSEGCQLVQSVSICLGCSFLWASS